MDKIANYIIFHPERHDKKVVATIINDKNEVISNWKGIVWVDSVGASNEDPFVFNNPWLYSYCHATQLRRNIRKDVYVQPGSKIVFIKGSDADNGILTVDTVFIVDSVLLWGKHFNQPQEVPTKYLSIKNNRKSEAWERHFKYPFKKDRREHINATHTYEAKLWSEDIFENYYSFLPLDDTGERVSIPFQELPPSISIKLEEKRKGKYPVLLSSEIDELIDLISAKTSIKVVKDIILEEPIECKEKRGTCGGC
ncbi:hypothetical protein [Dysgonomonas capnocytophagoides]|uniref:hypothetical protein n=1 Tax=Dysgonomonas capnocytophagoides TaxID=45254 RepID=UPI0033416DEE